MWDTRLGFVWARTSAGNPAGNAGGDLGKRGLNIVSETVHTVTPELQLRFGVNVVLERVDAAIDTIAGVQNDAPSIDRDEDGQNLHILPGVGVPDTYEDLLIRARRTRRQAELSGVLTPRNDSLGGAWVDLPWQPSARVSVTPGVRVDYYKTGNAEAFVAEPGIDAHFRMTPRLTAFHGSLCSNACNNFAARA